MSEHIDPHTIRQIHLGNVRDNQIGGVTDGITPEVAEDLGYETHEQTVEIMRSKEVAESRHPANQGPHILPDQIEKDVRFWPDYDESRIGRIGVAAARDALRNAKKPNQN